LPEPSSPDPLPPDLASSDNTLLTDAPRMGRVRLVAHFKDGQITKGFSRDFDPALDSFHLEKRRAGIIASVLIRLEDLKALFQVKTWGRKDRHLGRPHGFPEGDGNRPPEGSYVKTVAEFFDGERICGFTRDYAPDRNGFYLIPADPEDNNRRIYVLKSSLVNIQIFRD
jgi:hypothetical protein